MTQLFCRFGIPRQLHSDQAADFQAKVIEEICHLLQIRKTRTTPYRPQSDGLVERFNRTLLAMLSTVVREFEDDWDDHLPYVMLAYSSTVHESTGCSPSLMMMGREMNLPIDLLYPPIQHGESPQCATAYAQWLQGVMAEAHDYARRHLKKAAENQKRNYDARSQEYKLHRGDWVLNYYPSMRTKLGSLSQGRIWCCRG